MIKDHCFTASRAVLLGAATLEPYSVIGANATVLDAVTIARECVVGAGTVIHENTQEKCVYRVNPPTLLPLPSDKLANIISYLRGKDDRKTRNSRFLDDLGE